MQVQRCLADDPEAAEGPELEAHEVRVGRFVALQDPSLAGHHREPVHLVREAADAEAQRAIGAGGEDGANGSIGTSWRVKRNPAAEVERVPSDPFEGGARADPDDARFDRGGIDIAGRASHPAEYGRGREFVNVLTNAARSGVMRSHDTGDDA